MDKAKFILNAEDTEKIVDIFFELAEPVQSNTGLMRIRDLAYDLARNIESKHDQWVKDNK